jgi:hypothetical protein
VCEAAIAVDYGAGGLESRRTAKVRHYYSTNLRGRVMDGRLALRPNFGCVNDPPRRSCTQLPSSTFGHYEIDLMRFPDLAALVARFAARSEGVGST